MTTTAEPLDARTLPHNLEAERSLLGAVLLHDEALGLIASTLTDGMFFRDSHKRIYRAMLRLAERPAPIDLTTLKEELARVGDLDTIGGPSYLAALVDGIPRSTNIEHYATIVRSKARLREVIFASSALLADAYDGEEEADVLVDRAEQKLFQLQQGQSAGGFKRLSDIIPGVMEQIEAWCQSRQGVSGVASGFHDLDAMTRGFQPGNLVIVAARPSMGKSSLVLNIAQHVARGDRSVGFFSLEMSDQELGVRTLTAEAGIDGHRLQHGNVRESEWGRISAALGTLSTLNLFIDESPYITAFEMRAKARRLKAEHGLSLLIVDYTQLMIGQEKRENRVQELTAITRALKGLAKELKIPVLALSQLSREVEKRMDKRPMLADLRESGSLEQDADVVIFIYRESVYHETDENRRVAELIIGKQRNGPIGTVRVGWVPEQTKFVNLTDLAEPEDQRLPMGDR